MNSHPGWWKSWWFPQIVIAMAPEMVPPPNETAVWGLLIHGWRNKWSCAIAEINQRGLLWRGHGKNCEARAVSQTNARTVSASCAWYPQKKKPCGSLQDGWRYDSIDKPRCQKWVPITFGHRWSYIEHPLKCDDSSWFPLQKSAKNQAQIHQFAVSFLGRFPGQTSSRSLSSHPPEICGRIFCSACGFGKIRFHQATSQAFFRRRLDVNRNWADFSVSLGEDISWMEITRGISYRNEEWGSNDD